MREGERTNFELWVHLVPVQDITATRQVFQNTVLASKQYVYQ